MSDDDDGYVEGDSGSETADAPGTIPSDDAPTTERVQSVKAGTFDSTAVTDAPVHRRSDKTSRMRESREAFAKAVVAAKASNAATAATARPTDADEYDPEASSSTETAAPPAPPVPAGRPQAGVPTPPPAAAAPPPSAAPPAPSLDPEIRKLRDQLKADREEFERTRSAHLAEIEKAKTPAAAQSDALDYEAYVDSSARAYRTWMEHMRGEKFASEDDFRLEARDFITVLSRDVMGVPLSADESNGLESRMARKAVRVSKTVATRREQAMAEKAERERTEAATKAEEQRVEHEWTKAAEALTQHFGAQTGADGKAETAAGVLYPWLAAEESPGAIVVDVIRAAIKQDGTQLSWQEASKKANDFLKSQATTYYEKRRPLLSQAPAAPAAPGKPAAKPAAPSSPSSPTPPTPPPRSPETPTKYSKEKHLQSSLAKFRTAFQPGDK